jgi:seryl-tRNA synthetase
VRAALARRGADAGIDRVLELDARRRELLPQVEDIRAEQNKASKEIGAAKQRGEDAAEAIAAMEDVAARGRELSDEVSKVEAKLNAALAELPNVPDEDAPLEDTVLREVGEAGRTGRDHLELAGPLIDMETAARVSGSRFAYL